MNSTNNIFHSSWCFKVFLQPGKWKEEDNKNNHVLVHELPNDIKQKISITLLVEYDEWFKKLNIRDSKNYKL